MLTIIIKDNGERRVTDFTYENIWHDVKDMTGVEVIVEKSWIDALDKIQDRFVCLLESDCLVSPGYFKNQLDILKKNPMFRKVSMISSATAVKYWDNKFFGYKLNLGVMPVKDMKSSNVYSVQIGYVPGAIVHTGMLRKALKSLDMNNSWENDLVSFSTKLSLAFWKQGGKVYGQAYGNPVYVNPNVTYVTTEDYVNDINEFHDLLDDKLISMFKKESI